MRRETQQPVVLAILDGYGIAPHSIGNAITTANKPHLDKIFSDFAYTTLEAGGLAVGLPEGQMGNSEVGHTNIGAGRIVYQELSRITKAINDGDFFENPVILDACKGSTLHIMGLLSDGGVHSHLYHLKALVDMAVEEGVEQVFIHAFLDGRDTAPTSGGEFLWEIEDYIARYDNVKIATVCGRYYAMDRDNRYDRIQKAYDAIVYAKGRLFSHSFEEVEELYNNKTTDEFVTPLVSKEYYGLKDGDQVIFANFRPDRARQLSRALADPEFKEFAVEGRPNITLTTMTSYDREFEFVKVAYPPAQMANTLSQWLSSNGKKQLHISETEKYAHVTFFFAGGVEAAYEGEERILIDSPKVETYDLTPAMSADEITRQVVNSIKAKKYDFIVVNLANCDMIGHTGKMRAAVAAVEVVDRCVGTIRKAVESIGGILAVTSDHGNADTLVDKRGRICTAHSHAPVPFAINADVKLREGGTLSDIAPTLLGFMGLETPEEMTGKSLIIE